MPTLTLTKKDIGWIETTLCERIDAIIASPVPDDDDSHKEADAEITALDKVLTKIEKQLND